MKRILGAICIFGMISMFFTGCNSLIMPMEIDPAAVGSSVAATETAVDGVRLNYGEDSLNQEMPDYFEELMQKKFQDLGGKQAFKIKDGHSSDTDDIVDFQIESLGEDGTFLYAYTTRIDGDSMPRRMVHCAASYNYKSKAFKVLHEKTYKRDWEDGNEKQLEGLETREDQESFYIQTAGEDLFVYDNGVGFLYDRQGGLILETEIESFVRKNFNKAYSVNVVQAVTDGNKKIYLELAVEKNMVQIPESSQPDIQGSANTDTEREKKEDEEAEKEMEQQMVNLILVYNLRPVSTTINQVKQNAVNQERAWKDMTKDKEYTEEPDGEQDWRDMTKNNPDVWGCAFLPGLSSNKTNEDADQVKVYTWKDEPVFEYKDDGYICTFKPVNEHQQEFKNVVKNTKLKNTFIKKDGQYQELFGTTGEVEYYERITIERKYTLVTYEDETDAEGNVHSVKHTEEKSQTIKKCRRRKFPLKNNPYLEGYWIFEKDGITSLSNYLDGRILCATEKEAYWLMPDGQTKKADFDIEEGYTPGAFKDGNQVYLVASGGSSMIIKKDNTWDIHGGGTGYDFEKLTIPYSSLGQTYTHKDSLYDNEFMELNEKYMDTPVNIYGNADYYTQDGILKAELPVDSALLAKITKWQEELSSFLYSSSNGILLTSNSKGLIYYASPEDKSVTLLEGSWYRSWKQGDKIISVGFAKGEINYDAVDAAHARVYEYRLKDLYNDTIEEIIEALEKKEQEEKEKKAEESAAQSLEGKIEEETTKGLLEQWEEKHPEGWTEVDLETAVSHGETFDSDAFESTLAEKASLEESSRAQRINEILYGTSAVEQ